MGFDFEHSSFKADFQGLITTSVIFAFIATVSTLLYETLRQLRRLPKIEFVKFWKRDKKQPKGDDGVDLQTPADARNRAAQLTCEDWEMGHFYQSRMFHASTPSPPLARLPFAWISQAIRFTDQFYAQHTGMDTVVYVRFLRACFYWTLLQTFTTAPILLTIHIKFSKGADLTDMARASLSDLVTYTSKDCKQKCPPIANQQGRSLLWIHLCLLWYLTISWIMALWWIAAGSLKIRRSLIDKIRQKTQLQGQPLISIDPTANHSSPAASIDSNQHELNSAQGLPTDNSQGWRQRTLMIMNLPNFIRDEASIRRYFEEFLRDDDDDEGGDDNVVDVDHASSIMSDNPHRQHSEIHGVSGLSDSVSWRYDRKSNQPKSSSHFSRHSDAPQGPEPDLHPDRHLKSPVQTVVLVRKMSELSAMLTRRQEVLHRLEAAHMKLAQNVLSTVAKRTLKMQRNENSRLSRRNQSDSNSQHLKPWQPISHFISKFYPQQSSINQSPQDDMDPQPEIPFNAQPDVEKQSSAKNAKHEAKAKADELARRLARFSPTNRGFHSQNVPLITDQYHDDDSNQVHQTVWEALESLPRELLDPYQPVTRLTTLFRGQTVPTIDYLLTKLNLLTALVTEMRSRPPSSYEPTSTAFVTFRDPRQARMVWRELKGQLVFKVRLAPQVKDLDWEKLMRTSFTGDLVRGVGVGVAFWGFTIFFVVIVNLITNTLFSVQALESLNIASLNDFFARHPKLKAFIAITLPNVIVSLITMSIPELIFQVGKRAQRFVTFSALYDECLVRYWKFVICNVVIFFCLGVTTIQTAITQIGQPGNTNQILNSIAYSFPTAAPFYVSYYILQLGLHSGFEHMGFMVAILQHFGARKAFTPRARALKTLPRNFNRYYWLPLHINSMAIQFIFALLNPLVIPFALVYFSLALLVFKKNFAYHYYRRFNELQGAVYFTRILRFSLDAILVMQVVLLIFFSVIKKGPIFIGMTAVMIPLTVIVKLLATRLWKSQCRAVDDEEAEALCGIDSRPMWEKMKAVRDYGASAHDDTVDSPSPLDARASGRYPTLILPPNTGSAFYKTWQNLHDSFHANGMDRPSYIASAHAKGKSLHNPLEFSAKTLAKAPKKLARITAKTGNNFKSAAKVTLGMSGQDQPLRNSGERAACRTGAAVIDRSLDRLGDEVFDFSQDPVKGDEKHQKKEYTPSTLKADRAVSKRRKGDYGRSRTSAIGLARGNSTASEERPFLSGVDAVSAHAPVPTEDDMNLSFADGDEPFLQLHEDVARSKSLSKSCSSKGGYHHGTIKKKKSHLTIHEYHLTNEPIYEVAELTGSSSTQGIAQKLTERGESYDSSPPETRIMLPTSESSMTVHPSLATRKQTVAGFPQEEDEADDDSSEYDNACHSPYVQPHAPVRWDDTPSNTTRYNNPFYNRQLDPFLWLPRDPMARLDLNDTIEWHGPALVSSQGGPGLVGEWDDEEDQHQLDDEDTPIPLGGEAANVTLAPPNVLDGTEEIIMSDNLARYLEQVEDVEEAIDPAASVPRGILEDYKRAIRRPSQEISENVTSLRQPSFQRRTSNRSALSTSDNSIRSPMSLTRILDEEGSVASQSDTYGQQDAKPAHGKDDQLVAVPTQQRLSFESRQSAYGPSGSVITGDRKEEDRFATLAVPRDTRNTGRMKNASALSLSLYEPDTSVGIRRSGHDRSPVRTMRRDGSAAHSSIRTGTSQTSAPAKVVSLQAALKAEALEEERRITLKDELYRRKKKGQKLGKSEAGDRPDEEDGDETETIREASTCENPSTIMAKYEARQRQRIVSANEFGAMDAQEGRPSEHRAFVSEGRYGHIFRSVSGPERFAKDADSEAGISWKKAAAWSARSNTKSSRSGKASATTRNDQYCLSTRSHSTNQRSSTDGEDPSLQMSELGRRQTLMSLPRELKSDNTELAEQGSTSNEPHQEDHFDDSKRSALGGEQGSITNDDGGEDGTRTPTQTTYMTRTNSGGTMKKNR